VQELVGVDAEVEAQTVTAAAGDPGVLPAVVRRLDEAGVAIAELTLRNASLNEVFLSLTGHPAEEAGAAGDVRDDGQQSGPNDEREGVKA
jgi:oleandomycin transport system ATP-binding protein